MLNFFLGIVLTIVTGLVDGQAFSKAPQIWSHSGTERVIEFIKTLTIFFVGLNTYIFSTYFFYQHGVSNALIITLVWFVATIISVALIGGTFAALSPIDKLISIAAIILVGFLYYRGVASE
ncbi:hypothetical protein A2961_02125 [Candidatus Woesebacteria bacterium RIFCSPLOWO2_01_FULL_39_21]|uniref:EamA domain-containing protein n=1 Tax=Candidatus Woesebacteria bacterium RIFCSPLOWO2_01_FULL_39_21 TaxID=1802519 RepID=A0A1F8BB84_9BACT|nr:MAG: hypothetical protein A2691_00720 [Candidatus Woesebacteria bacterium RIFCSPHIGHO2_01_FULL_39_23]OGM61306.1 MAG: hypothetical protein A2961_02125 [Candidatus Woesebacteria bacterium RIFCSPLOWO2_01_FULL_39_21]